MEKSKKYYAKNKKASWDYELSDCIEVGIVLTGSEVKSIKSSNISLKESFVSIDNGEAWLKQCHVTKISSAYSKHDETRPKKLLLHKKEIIKLIPIIEQKGYTLLLKNIYDVNGKIKATLCVGKGKQLFDKRKTMKEKQINMDAKREIKEYH